MHTSVRSSLPPLCYSDLPGDPRSMHSIPSSDGEDEEEDIIEDIELMDLVNSAKKQAARSNRYPARSAITHMRAPTANALAASAMASYFPTAVTIEPMSTKGGSSSLKSTVEELVRYMSTSKSKGQKSKNPAVPTVNHSHHGKFSHRRGRNSGSFNPESIRRQGWWNELFGRDIPLHSNPTKPTILNGGMYDSTSRRLSATPEREADANLMADYYSRHVPSERRNAMDLADPDEERRQFFTSFDVRRMRPGGMASSLNAFDDDYKLQSHAKRFGYSQENVNHEHDRIRQLTPCLPTEPQQCYSRSGRSGRNENTYHTSGPLLSSGFTENLRLEAEHSVKLQAIPDLAFITNKTGFVAASIDKTKTGGDAAKADSTNALMEAGANSSFGSFSTVDLAASGVQYLSFSGTLHHSGQEPLGNKFMTKWKEAWARVFITSGK
ncbi:hypothetical protein V1509DRAFT_630019 [Lipomyces kononenkoae]